MAGLATGNLHRRLGEGVLSEMPVPIAMHMQRAKRGGSAHPFNARRGCIGRPLHATMLNQSETRGSALD
jgi:hypothetical protein